MTKHKHKNRMQSTEEQGSTASRMQNTLSTLRHPDEMIRQHPGSSAMTTFAIGCGLGLLTAWMMLPARRSRQSWYDSYNPTRWTAGKRFAASMGSVPESIGSYFSRR